MRKMNLLMLAAVWSAVLAVPTFASGVNSGPGAAASTTVSEDVTGPAVGASVETVSGQSKEAVGTVTYEALETLLLSGNLDLKTRTDSLTSTKKDYQELLETLRNEQDYMKFLAKASDEDSEEEAMYEQSANMLAQSAKRVSSQLKRLNSRSSAASLQSAVDTYLVTAQSRYKSYKKMQLNLAAKEKSTEAAERVWQETVKKQSAGLAASADVMQAADRYEQQKNTLFSYQQQEQEQRRQLLTFLGISDLTISILEVPKPDLAAIDAIDFETDRQKAINNNSSVQSERHAKAGTSYEIERKAVTVAAAEGSAEASIVDAYQQLLAQRSTYQAALDAYESARISWNSAKLKQQAGMLDATAWLEAEASWLQAVADHESASMELLQAYEDYQWEVKGL